MTSRFALACIFLVQPVLAQGPSPYEQAVAARHSGNPSRAVELLEPLVRADPGNSDAWVQLGYAQLALGRFDEAEHSFRRALAIAPNYRDASEGIALVSRRRATPASRLRLDIDGALTWIGRRQSDWREGAAQLRADVRPGLAVTGRIEGSRRFGESDIYLESRVDVTGGRGNAYLLAGATPKADFRPKKQLGAGGAFRLLGGTDPTVATIDTRWARYRSGAIWTISPGVDQYFGDGRAWLTARWINVVENGKTHGGWLARGDFQSSPKLRLFAGVADAPDTSEGVVIGTFSLFGGIVASIDDRRSLRLSLARDKPEGGATRTQLGIGAGIRF